MSRHRWKMSFPGNYCLDCGAEDPVEANLDSLVNCDACNDGDNGDCQKCYGTGAMINPDLVIFPCLLDRSNEL